MINNNLVELRLAIVNGYDRPRLQYRSRMFRNDTSWIVDRPWSEWIEVPFFSDPANRCSHELRYFVQAGKKMQCENCGLVLDFNGPY